MIPCLSQVHHRLDAVAAKGMMERASVGRVRRLSVRVLWIQGWVDGETILLHKVPTATNPSDLGTKSLSRARVRLLLYMLGAYAATLDERVGESEYAELQQKQAMKDAIKLSKPMIRAIVIAMCSASSRAADDLSDENGNQPDEDAWMSTMMSVFGDIMVWVIVLYEQDPVLFAMCVQIVLLVVMFIGFGMRCQCTVPLHLRD